MSHHVSTLHKHAYERVAGLKMPGIFEVPNTVDIGRAIDDLLLTNCRVRLQRRVG